MRFQVTVDVRSPHNGTISKIYAEEGQEVNVDENLFDLTPGSASVTVVPAADAKRAAPQGQAKENNVPPAASAAKPAAPSAIAAKKIEATPVAAAAVSNRSEVRVKMTRMRQRIAQRLKESQNTAAMLTTFQEVDMTNLIELRNKYKEDFEKAHGVKLGFMSAFVKVRFVSIGKL